MTTLTTPNGHKPHPPTEPEPAARPEPTQAQSARGVWGNHKRWHEARGLSDPRCPHCPDTPAERSAPRTKKRASAKPSRPWYDSANLLVVALVAAAASYGHLYHVALLAGEPLWIARAFPITVDGLALAALRRGDAGRAWLAFALAVSVAANVLAQFPELAQMAGPAVSAFPPVALYGTHRLVHSSRN